jgi:hypothetical protein
VNCAEKDGNRAAERRFGSFPTVKVTREWRKQTKTFFISNFRRVPNLVYFLLGFPPGVRLSFAKLN